jgi:hypothetical protein
MLERARAQAAELAGGPLDDPAQRVVQLLQVAGDALRLDVGPLGPLARLERRLVRTHEERVESPILTVRVDYSLFTPRGHYTRTRELTRYFLAMSVLGQMPFLLPGAMGSDGVAAGAAPLRLGALASRALVGDARLEALWRAVFEPTAFLVGVADDYTPMELAAALEATAPGTLADPTALADDAVIEALGAALQATRPVRIDPERPALRLMGTRFVFDSWVLDQLVYPHVGTSQEPRGIASPLDLASAFGSDFAYGVQDAAGETRYANYEPQMAAMREALGSRSDEAWGSTVYDAWLAAVEPSWLPHGLAFPDYMRSEAWAAKAHQTGFGSYAELRHDTILYAKPYEAGTGGGPEAVPSLGRNWVEPDPVPFARLSAVAGLTREGLSARRLLSPKMDTLLQDFIELTDFLTRIATDELADDAISEADDERLRFISGELERFWCRTSDLGRCSGDTTQDPDAIVADIGRGLGAVLEIATGHVDRILVVVPDGKGGFAIAEGGVFSYYEFLQPESDLLTDEAWRAMLREGDAPERPAWQAVLFASAS